MDLLERFWSKVQKTETCWVWTACRTWGYGQFSVGHNQRVRAHRYSYELLVGPIPDGLQIDHLCRNHACVRPDHLEPVTARENMIRGFGPAANNARKTSCQNGHPLSGNNLRIGRLSRGGLSRVCKKCHAEDEIRRKKERVS